MNDTPPDPDTSFEERVRRAAKDAIEAGAEEGQITIRWSRGDSGVQLTVLGSTALGSTALGSTALGSTASGPDTSLESTEPAAFLLVEDHELSARALARSLRSYGTVVSAATLKEARARYAEGHRWLGLLLDVNLPDGSGLDFLEEVRRHDPRVPVLVLTGELDPERTNRAQSLDAEFAFKPYDDANLRSFAVRARARLYAEDRSVASIIAALVEEHGLTHREADVLAITVGSDGSPRAAAAAALGFSPNTAKVHIGSILKKTGYTRLADLSRRILRDAWVATRPSSSTPPTP